MKSAILHITPCVDAATIYVGRSVIWGHVMKDGQYIVIQSFMVEELHLKGNELIVYAAIYGFTQDGEHWFFGTKGYLAEWCGATKATVGNCLKSLVEKGYIERREFADRGNVSVEYRATRREKICTTHTKNCTPPVQNLYPPHTKIDPYNNIEDTDSEKDIDMGEEPKKTGFKPPTREEVRAYVKERGYHFDADYFYDYYDASDWYLQGGKRVTKWKQCCVTWERRCKDDKGTTEKGRLNAYNYRQ